MKKVILVFILFISFHSSAKCYKGNIGQFPIFLKIENISDNGIEAYYFYEDQLKNISLKGKLKDNRYFLHRKFSNPEEEKEVFTLEKINNKLIGKWVNENKTLNVRLIEFEIDFESYKKNKLKLERKEIERFNNLEIVWFNEKYSGIRLFRIGNGFKKSSRKFLNNKLDSIHNENALLILECGNQQLEFEPRIVNDSIVSLTENYNIYCGGAHPSYGINGFNYNIKKDIEIKNLEKLFKGLSFVELLKEKYNQNTELQDECEYFDSDNKNMWKYAQFYFNKRGLIIIPSYPHALGPCEEEFEILYSEIKK